MHIRRAKTGDETAIANVVVKTWKDAYQGIVPQSFLDSLTIDKFAQRYKETIPTNKEPIFVLEDKGGKIVGMVLGGADRSGKYDCELMAIYILPEYQNKGYGRKLFLELIKEHKKNNYRSMIIWTFEDNRDREFYEKLGGVAREEQNLMLADKELRVIGYVWDDIGTII